MIDLVGLLAAALALLVLAGLLAFLLAADLWPTGRDVLGLRLAFGFGALLIFVAVVLTAYAYDRGITSALLFPQTQQAQRAPPAETAPVKPGG